jgi:DNA transformation protein and related proteins
MVFDYGGALLSSRPMDKGADFAGYCCELLASLGKCTAKRMFGGYGISVEGLTIAIVADLGNGLTLWLKADDESAARYEKAGCSKFTYLAKGVPRSVNYYSAPEDALESPQLMAPWARQALASALKAQSAKPSVRRPATKPQAKPAKPATRRPAARPPKTSARRKSDKG